MIVAKYRVEVLLNEMSLVKIPGRVVAFDVQKVLHGPEDMFQVTFHYEPRKPKESANA